MAYKQTKPFNKSKGGHMNGYCLQNVRLGFGIPVKHPNAIKAWQNTEKHTDRNIPGGVDVPLFYAYKNDGHVNVRLADGRIWNDGTIFRDLSTYLSLRPQVSYLGWGESVNGVRVIQHVPDPAPAPASRFAMPPINSRVKLRKGVTRTTFNSKGKEVGSIYAKDDTYEYVVRGINGNRIVINSASGGGNGVELALYYLSGNRIDGWTQL